MTAAVELLREINDIFQAAAKGDAARVLSAMEDERWHIVQAALHAVRQHPRAQYAPAIVKALARQETLDLYGQKDEVNWPAGVPACGPVERVADIPKHILETWKCRWRVKQAACHALGAIGQACGRGAVAREAVERMCKYVHGRVDDYQVRAAACQALGQIGDPAAQAALEIGAADEEFCTKTEAQMALAKLKQTC